MSQEEPFVHLHVHSEYSLLDGLSRLNELVQRAQELNQPAIALTDHGAMYGTMPFYRAAKQAGIKPIIGIESYLASRAMQDRDAELDRERFHMLLLAQNQTGYLNLLQIASSAQLEGYYYKPRIDRAFMAAHSEGLVATTGCMAAEIPRAIGDGNMKKAHKLMGEYVDIFGRERLFVELQEHHIPELTAINKKLIEMAPRYGLEKNLLATNDVHYTHAADAEPHEVLLCIQTGSTIKNPKLTFSDKEYYLKSHSEMALLFAEIPGALSNSVRIAEMCNVELDSEGYHLPDFDVPEGYDPHSYLRHLCQEGLEWRYGAERAAHDEQLRRRLDHELNIIHRMAFDTYFLIVWDLCEWAARSDRWWERHQDPYPYDDYAAWKEHDIWWNVRGSGAGSVVAYTLGITSIDPLENGLIFERFLNPGRLSMPDIDLDYPDDMRHLMVAYTKRRYGQEKVAQIITFGTLGARAAIRDVGRAMDLVPTDVDAIARMVPAIPGKPAHISDVLNPDHEFYQNELARRYKQEQEVRTLLDTARNLEGVSRHASSHAAGVIVSDRPLHEYVPLNRPTSGSEGLGGLDRVTQWPMEIVESIGLLKVDFLGLSTLTVMRRAARLIEERYGTVYTMDNIPYDVGQVGPDPEKKPDALFDMLGHGQVAGVFQVEGAGMRRLMMEMKPRRFDHIIAAISLYRPGPMENIPEYIRRMHAAIYDGKDEVKYHTPELEPILRDTYGILVYQEQIIRIASDLAGYEPGEADMIRKAVAKKKKKLMEEHRLKFTDGAMARGFSREVCDAIWGDIEFFARYGFNKAHAADYAKVTCQTAFLKAHYPVEYLTAMLSVERDNTEKVRRYFAEAKNLGITIAPPDINRSGLGFTIEETEATSVIRFGLGAIKNAGEAALSTIIKEREAAGPFQDLQDLCDRVDLRRVGKRPLEYMIKARVFERWGTVPQMMEGLDRIMSASATTHQAAEVGQMSLFGGLGGAGAGLQLDADLLKPADEVDEIDHKQLLEWEKEALGVHVSEHPLERPLAMLESYSTSTIAELDATQGGKTVRVAGMISQLRTLTTRTREAMAFATLEDLEAKIDLVFFPKTWEKFQDEVVVDQVMLVTGRLQVKDDDLNIIVERVSTKLEMASAAEAPGWDQEYRYTPPEMPMPDDLEDVSPASWELDQPGAPVKRHAPSTSYEAPLPPPPPPEFDMNISPGNGRSPTVGNGKTNRGTNGAGNGVVEAGKTDGHASAIKQDAAPSTVVGAKSFVDRGGRTVTVPQEWINKGKRVLVDVQAVSNWQQTFRRCLQVAGDYEGVDSLDLRLRGQQLRMSFPNRTTHFCDELIEALENLPGVVRVLCED